jgi:hypothetical protein
LRSHIGRPNLQISSSHAISSWWRWMQRSFDKNRNPNLTDSCYIFGGTFGKNVIEGYSNVLLWELMKWHF